ncbi:hypothetical protein [Kingella negevensis]|nr:hypothetical protein [Kingella negevensis]MDK4681130.1 hypothetical protein [Kingella negevensis]MDK4683332.1 hypothetical protein [Kingella negevensis]
MIFIKNQTVFAVENQVSGCDLAYLQPEKTFAFFKVELTFVNR